MFQKIHQEHYCWTRQKSSCTYIYTHMYVSIFENHIRNTIVGHGRRAHVDISTDMYIYIYIYIIYIRNTHQIHHCSTRKKRSCKYIYTHIYIYILEKYIRNTIIGHGRRAHVYAVRGAVLQQP